MTKGGQLAIHRMLQGAGSASLPGHGTSLANTNLRMRNEKDWHFLSKFRLYKDFTISGLLTASKRHALRLLTTLIHSPAQTATSWINKMNIFNNRKRNTSYYLSYLHLANDWERATSFTGLTGTDPGELSIEIGASLHVPATAISE